MKANAKKILLFLYVKENEQYFFASKSLLKIPVPGLSESGQRSLLTLLKTRGFITLENIGDEPQYRITVAGSKALKTALPVLMRSQLEWSRTWSCLVFKEAPIGDLQFRYLRKLLVKHQSVALSRGVYLYPDAFPAQILSEVDVRYSKSVSLFEIGKWLTDDERQIAISQYGLLDLIQNYSGISSEIERLIDKKKSNKGLNHQEKIYISSFFNRLYEIMSEDMGLLRYYFPQVKSGVEILITFQKLCLELFS